MHRDLTCGNVFERRAQRKASFAAPQTEWRDAGLPGAKRRDADSRVAFSLGTCLLATQKKVPRLTGRDPSSVVYDDAEGILIAACACGDWVEGRFCLKSLLRRHA